MRVLYSAIALAALALTVPVRAGTVVHTDSGNIGAFRATNTGIVAGTSTIVFDVPSVTSQLNTVNGSFILPEPTAVAGPLTLLVTPSGLASYDVVLSPASAMQFVGAVPGAQAVLDFSLSKGATPLVLPDFLNLTGTVTGLGANLDPLYDFSQFGNGLGSINITLTATDFTGANSFANFIATPGAVAVGNGSFSQVSIPEPTSLALMGIGMGLLIAWRGIVQRRKARVS